MGAILLVSLNDFLFVALSGFTAEQTSFQADVTLRKKTGKIMREV